MLQLEFTYRGTGHIRLTDQFLWVNESQYDVESIVLYEAEGAFSVFVHGDYARLYWLSLMSEVKFSDANV